MFRRGWLNRGRIRSDMGYEITIIDRAHLEYKEDNNRIMVGGELLTDGFVIEVATIIAWDNGTSIDENTRRRIIENIRLALESQGMIVDLG